MLSAYLLCMLLHNSNSKSGCLCRRVKKYGPVFKSNIYGQDVIVVADFPGLQKVQAFLAPCP